MTPGERLREAETIIESLLRDTEDYGAPALVAKSWAQDFLKRAALYAAQPPQDERGQPVALSTLTKGARTITAGDGLPYMTIRFDTLADVYRANDEINALAASAPALQAGQGEPADPLMREALIEAAAVLEMEDVYPELLKQIRAALTSPTHERAAPAPEPVAVISERGLRRLAEGKAHCVHAYAKVVDEDDVLLYRVAPSQPVAAEGAGERADVVPLSEEQIDALASAHDMDKVWYENEPRRHWRAFARSVIAASQDSAKGGK